MTPRPDRNPLQAPSTRVRCPVCHEVVYSRAGIHPQCAVRRSDPPRPKVKSGGPGPEEIPAVEEVVEPPEPEVLAEPVAAAGPVAPPKGSKGNARRRP